MFLVLFSYGSIYVLQHARETAFGRMVGPDTPGAGFETVYEDEATGFRLALPEAFETAPNQDDAIRSDREVQMVLQSPEGVFVVLKKTGGAIVQNDPKFVRSISGHPHHRVSWFGVELFVFEVAEQVGGRDYMNYNIQFPTFPKMHQVTLFGPAADLDRLNELEAQLLSNTAGRTKWKAKK
jgi:hypothetical protein